MWKSGSTVRITTATGAGEHQVLLPWNEFVARLTEVAEGCYRGKPSTDTELALFGDLLLDPSDVLAAAIGHSSFVVTEADLDALADLMGVGADSQGKSGSHAWRLLQLLLEGDTDPAGLLDTIRATASGSGGRSG